MNAMYLAATSSGGAGSFILGLVVIFGSIIGYFVPTITAMARKVPNTGSVVVVNVFLGWTVIGWIVALAMACRSRPPAQIPPGVAQPGGGWISGPSNPSR